MQNATAAATTRPTRSPVPAASAAGPQALNTPAPIIEPARRSPRRAGRAAAAASPSSARRCERSSALDWSRRRSAVRRAGRARRGCRTGPGAGSACRRGRHDVVAERRAGVARRATSASMSSTMRWIRFQPPGPAWRRRPSAARPSSVGPDEQQAQVAALDVGERGREARQDLEAEQLGVEGDRRLDVVDHVADVDDLIVDMCGPPRCWWSGEQVEPEADAGLELVGGALERRVAWRGRSAPSSAGSGMLQCTSSGRAGNVGQTSRTRSHRVITVSKRSARNSSRCLVRFALMSMPRRPAPGPRSGAAASGGCRRCGVDGAGRHLLEQRLGDLGPGAVAGAQEQHPSVAATARRGPRATPAARVAAPGGALRPRLCSAVAAAIEVDRVVAVAPVRRAAASASRARRRGAGAGGTRPGSAARRPAPSAPSRPGRCAPAPAATASAPDATPAARIGAVRRRPGRQ